MKGEVEVKAAACGAVAGAAGDEFAPRAYGMEKRESMNSRALAGPRESRVVKTKVR